MKDSKIFLFFVAIYFAFFGVFHFARLAFEWDLIVGDFYLHSWMSAVCVILAVFVVYWIYRMRKKTQKEVKVKSVEDSSDEESKEEQIQ